MQGATVHGELADWPSKDRLAAVLRDFGLHVTIGKYSVAIDDCSHFKFVQYGGDISPPCIDADADSAEEMIGDARLVSDALAASKIIHRIEVCDERGGEVAYLHFGWPKHFEKA
jgi:hypothetical protein